jgi:hypothetical protein
MKCYLPGIFKKCFLVLALSLATVSFPIRANGNPGGSPAVVAIIGGRPGDHCFIPANIARAFFQDRQKGKGPTRLVAERFPEPLSEEAALDLWKTLNDRQVVAAICSSRGMPALIVCRAGSKGPFPLILLYSGGIPPESRDSPGPFIFSMDLPESSLLEAFSEWASREGGKWAILTDHLDASSISRGKNVAEALRSAGSEARILVLAGSADARLVHSVKKCIDDGITHILSTLAPGGTVRIASALGSTGGQTPRLVYWGEPPDDLRGIEGLSVLSQEQHTPLEGDKTGIFSGFLEDDSLRPATIRTVLACQWILEASSAVGAGTAPTLAEAMKEAGTVAFFGKSLEISPCERRPVSGEVFVLESRNGRWHELDRIKFCVTVRKKE